MSDEQLAYIKQVIEGTDEEEYDPRVVQRAAFNLLQSYKAQRATLARYEAALKEYANEDNWCNADNHSDYGCVFNPKALRTWKSAECWRLAQAALRHNNT